MSAIKITVTGAAGQIGYALLFRIANGDLLGKNQPIILKLLEIPNEKSQQALQGVIMELDDCAFPLLEKVEAHDDPKKAFADADIVFLVGARARGPGMERKDLMAANAEIFKVQGNALNETASRDVKVLVVGNPANTNAYIALQSAPNLGPRNFSAMMRLDHNRALHMLAQKISQPLSSIENLCVWGNHSPTMYADVSHAKVNGKAVEVDAQWNTDIFLPTVAKRGASIIAARGLSSAASAANAAIDQMRDWCLGTDGKWCSMAVASNGSYGIPEGIVCGFPVVCSDGDYRIVEGLSIDDFSRERISLSLQELEEERASVTHLL